jgi:hypothetical protein
MYKPYISACLYIVIIYWKVLCFMLQKRVKLIETVLIGNHTFSQRINEKPHLCFGEIIHNTTRAVVL